MVSINGPLQEFGKLGEYGFTSPVFVRVAAFDEASMRVYSFKKFVDQLQRIAGVDRKKVLHSKLRRA